ncbi:MAG: hypothetical protein HKN27_12460 [Silicimonas sp.]|nr:hypothetical protein [Silicimonas sp.]
MVNDSRQDQALAALFDAGKSNAATPEADFMAQLQVDMEDAIPVTAVSSSMPPPSLLTRLGGLFAASSLTGAAALGVWIGFVMPETLNTLTDGFIADETVSLSALLPGSDLAALSE